MNYLINGGNKLNGALRVQSAKNCAIVMQAVSLLTEQQLTITEFPMISDCLAMNKILSQMGCKTTLVGDCLTIDSESVNTYVIPDEFSKTIRGSVFLLGGVLARFKKAVIALPGGCDIGARPIDIHIDGLRKMGVTIVEEDNKLYCDAENAKGARIDLRFQSVGATENLIMFATLTRGETNINNCAIEPEIVALCKLLIDMGAKIQGVGTKCVTIEGVNSLSGATVKPIFDRIVAGTYLLACAICGGKIELSNCNARFFASLVNVLDGNSLSLVKKSDSIIAVSRRDRKAITKIETNPYPAFPTDLQSPLLSLLCVSKGKSVIVENMFENRFRNVIELSKMGAKVSATGKQIHIEGVERLRGGVIQAYDLRGGAGLALAGLNAEGQTTIHNVQHIERGYCNFDTNLRSLGADIVKID
ncbi:MAG: UDP-N-acetylglucosamine 1-carboxyvinyltransferase [Clostridia bacterium]